MKLIITFTLIYLAIVVPNLLADYLAKILGLLIYLAIVVPILLADYLAKILGL